MIRKNATAFCQYCLSVWGFLFVWGFFSVFSPRGEERLHDHEGDVLTDVFFVLQSKDYRPASTQHRESASILHRTRKETEELGGAGYKGTQNPNNFNYLIQIKYVWSQFRHVARKRRGSRALRREKDLLIMKSGKRSFLLDHHKQIAFSVSLPDFYFILSWCYTAIWMKLGYKTILCSSLFFSFSLAINISCRKTTGMLPQALPAVRTASPPPAPLSLPLRLTATMCHPSSS